MKSTRRLKRQVQRLHEEKLALRKVCDEVVDRLDTAVKLIDQRPPPAEVEMAAMRERHHSFMAAYRAQQQKGEA